MIVWYFLSYVVVEPGGFWGEYKTDGYSIFKADPSTPITEVFTKEKDSILAYYGPAAKLMAVSFNRL